ncbi:terminase large subunit domain-containing protein [Sphingomonas sp.]|uniref:phage terminase large subunit family protein n=1 Tax=Sphingomonas sp. TaxID=28214 RepID=UPI00286A2926|nr:terminase family protein [Sphingomonas sp.]
MILRPDLDALDGAGVGALIAQLTLEEGIALEAHWPIWAHGGQLPPPGEWRTWVMLAGRGFGKTRAGAEWLAGMVRDRSTALGTNGERLRIALVGATVDEARRVMVEGESGLLTVAGDLIEQWSPARRLLQFRGGSEAVLFSGASPDSLRGPEHHFAWCDEIAKWVHGEESWDNLQLGLRLGPGPQALVTSTPRGGTVLERIIGTAECVVSGGPTWANPHLPPAFVDAVTGMFAGTRKERVELHGELIRDAAGALWTVEMIEACRIQPGGALTGLAPAVPLPPPPVPYLKRIGGPPRVAERWADYQRFVIGVDPPAGDGTCGIVLCALDWEGIGHVLGDHSIGAVSPGTWAARVAAVATLNPETLVVAEVNQGGVMVETVLRTADPALRIKLVRASVGKSARAEPVAMLFEQGRVRLHGRMDALEAELRGMVAGGGYKGPGASPDRADAMVWALSELLVAPRAEPRVVMF